MRDILVVLLLIGLACPQIVKSQEHGNQRFVLAETHSNKPNEKHGRIKYEQARDVMSLIEEEESNTRHHIQSEGVSGLEGAQITKCVAAVHVLRSKFIEEQKPDSALPEYLEKWCVSVGERASGKDQEGRLASQAWTKGCEDGRKSLEATLSQGKPFAPRDFCSSLSVTLGTMAQRVKLYHFGDGPASDVPYSPPIATKGCKLQYLKQPRPCCEAHGYKGCHDSIIEECVCGVDAKCCTDGWDLRCSELVEKMRIRDGNTVLRCGRCPREIVGEAAKKACADSVMQK